MRKMNVFFGVGAICLALLMASCGGDTVNNPPVITFDATSPIALSPGVSAVTLTGSIVSEAGLSDVKIFKVTGLSEVQLTSITSFSTGEITTTDNLNYDFTYAVTDITEEISIKFTATDKDDQVTSQSIVIQGSAGSISSFSAILLGAQTNAEPSCLDANTGTRYSVNQATQAAVIDFVYYYGSSNLATIAAPNDPSINGTGTNPLNWTNDWDPQNATLFGVTTLDFADVNYGDLSGISGLADSKMNDLAVDDIFAFQTVDGKKGLVKVTDLSTGTSGSITIHVKIQE